MIMFQVWGLKFLFNMRKLFLCHDNMQIYQYLYTWTRPKWEFILCHQKSVSVVKSTIVIIIARVLSGNMWGHSCTIWTVPVWLTLWNICVSTMEIKEYQWSQKYVSVVKSTIVIIIARVLSGNMWGHSCTIWTVWTHWIWHVYRRQILTSKGGPRVKRFQRNCWNLSVCLHFVKRTGWCILP